MSYRAGLTRISHNVKTGPIPVSTTEARTCPPTCPQFDTCYAKAGPLAMHWKRVSEGDRGVPWSEFCAQVKSLPPRQLWRHNQAGDLPGDGVLIDQPALDELVRANKGKRGFTYTHYPLVPENLRAIEAANEAGFTINISCDSLTDADRVTKEHPGLPLAVVLPSMTNVHSLVTPRGTQVVVCPATYRDDMNCARCQICQERRPNRAVIGFPAHGTWKKKIDIKLLKDTREHLSPETTK